MRRPNIIYPAQNETQSLGRLTVNCNRQEVLQPIPNAKVVITRTGSTEPIEELTTDISGQTLEVELPTPPLDYSLEPNSPKPYAEYNVTVTAPDFEETVVEGTQVLPNELAIQNVSMLPQSYTDIVASQEQVIQIGPHTLYYDYPPKIPESPVKEDVEQGFIVLSEPVVPQTIIVHDGAPDEQAPNYYVPFRDYIKNVASSEIYSTWPLSSIQANILVILSFTLNRVYTEWYRGKGYNFTITSSTAYDQKFIYGRNIYQNISREVDALFTNYVSKPGIRQPLFTQYCNGTSVTCPTWLSQWGSKYLADQGYNTIGILRYYYGQDIFLRTATQVAGIPSSFPGYNLQVGSRGNAVRTIQSQLNRISNNFPAIPKVTVDGIYGPRTRDAVRKFQEVFYLPANGIVDYPTWYKISDVFVAVSRMAG